jgi:hypothetical protein
MYHLCSYIMWLIKNNSQKLRIVSHCTDVMIRLFNTDDMYRTMQKMLQILKQILV